MLTRLLLLLFFLNAFMAYAQKTRTATRKNQFSDSAVAESLREEQLYELPILTMGETEKSSASYSGTSSLLSAGKDVFQSMAAFHFSAMRFRPRGLDASQTTTIVNGISMNDIESGTIQWGLWSGLNEVSVNTQSVYGLRAAEWGMGGAAGLQAIDMRASSQREQYTAGYTISNRVFRHKWSFAGNTGFTKKGWAFAFAGSIREAEEGYFPGTPYHGRSYYVAADKRLPGDHLLSFVFFGSATRNSRQAAVLKESTDLSATNFYNPGWGYQDGKKRNANELFSHIPVLIISDEKRFSNEEKLVISFGMMYGRRERTGFDWYRADDPRPDYYRYLPSFQQDALLAEKMQAAFRDNESLRQIDWQKIYDINRNSYEVLQNANGITGNSFAGLRSHYWLAAKTNHITNVNLALQYDVRLQNGWQVNAGGKIQYQYNRNRQKAVDLLGGEYISDINAFAEDNTIGSERRKQNDLDHPNQLVTQGGYYGYDYTTISQTAECFGQVQRSFAQFDFFAGAGISTKGFYRIGNKRNGLYPFQSAGESGLLSFTNFTCKAGIIWKINGRNYLSFLAMLMNRAPDVESVFIDPALSDAIQQGPRNEAQQHGEISYQFVSPAVKFRISGYFSRYRDGMDLLTFYHDGYKQFVNDAISGIGKTHLGIETGASIKITSAWKLMAAVNFGRYYFDTRQQLSVTSDNDNYVLERGWVYAKGFHVAGTPQELYGMGLLYQAGQFYCTLTASFFRENWLAWNPFRRTYAVMENVVPGSAQWEHILAQEKLPDQFMTNLSAGGSFRLRLPGGKHHKQIRWNLSLNNLLNDTKLVTGGYEQLRFDTDNKEPGKFPPRYYYAMGLNYSFHISVNW